MTKNFELLTLEELLNLPIDIESCFDPIFEPPQEIIDEWNAACVEPDEVPTFYVTDEVGTLYFYHGNTRIRVAEHFNDRGKPIGTLIEDVIRYSAAHQTEKPAEN